MRLQLIVILLLALMAAACGGSPSASRTVDDAAALIERGDFKGAHRKAEAVMADSAALNSLTVSQLCRLAVVFVRLSNQETPSETDANDAMAARCLSRARAVAPDSVAQFIGSLTGEMAGRIIVLDQVGTFLTTPRDSLTDTPDDSLSIN